MLSITDFLITRTVYKLYSLGFACFLFPIIRLRKKKSFFLNLSGPSHLAVT